MTNTKIKNPIVDFSEYAAANPYYKKETKREISVNGSKTTIIPKRPIRCGMPLKTVVTKASNSLYPTISWPNTLPSKH